MSDKGKSKNKTAQQFRELAQKAFDFRGVKIVTSSSFDEMIAFTKLHNHFLTMGNLTEKNKELLRDRYPFMKIQNRWQVSIPKLYLYLVAARQAVGTFQDDDMVSVYVMTQQAMRYLKEVKEIDIKLTPKGHWDYDSYTRMQAALYEDYMMQQIPLFV